MLRCTHLTDRRTALKAFATNIPVGIAGCLDGVVDGNRSKSPQTTTPSNTATPTATETPSSAQTKTNIDLPGVPNYMDWVFATGLVDYAWPIMPFTSSPSKIIQFREKLNSNAVGIFNQMVDFPLVAAQVGNLKISSVIGTRQVYVMLGDFKQRAVDRNRLKKFERELPKYRGFLFYENHDEGGALAAKDGVVIATEQPGQNKTPREVLKHVIDTKQGDTNRLMDVRPQVSPLARWLGDRTFTQFSTHQPYTDREPPGKIGAGGSYEFNDTDADARYIVQFEDASQATDDAVDTWLDAVNLTDDWTDRSRTYYDEIVLVDGTVSYDTILSRNS